MSFLHLWPLGVGLLALGAPLAIHFLTKPKPVEFQLSTIRFLADVIEQRRARRSLRDWLILLLRMLCIALLALALARPLIKQNLTVPIAGEQEAQRVIVIDQSLSMKAGSGGITHWSAAVAAASQYLESANGMRAAVIYAGAKPRPIFRQMSTNFSTLRESIKQTQPLAERCDPRAAIELAVDLLKKNPGDKKEIVLISDFQRSNWGFLVLDLVPSEIEVQFHQVSIPETINLAIEEVRLSSQPVAGQPLMLEVDIANHSDQAAEVSCQVDFKQSKYQLAASIGPQSTQTINEQVTFEEVGWFHGQAKLLNHVDVLTEDNERWVAFEVKSAPKVGLMTQQAAREIPSSSFYLQQALRVALSADKSVQRIHPQRSSPRDWPVSDAWVIDHPGSLNEEAIRLLSAQVRRGRGMLYVVSELSDAVNLQKLAESWGTDFQPPVDLVIENHRAARQNLFIRKVRNTSGPISNLGGNQLVSMLKPVRFQEAMATTKRAEGLSDQILMELSDTTALLYSANIGAGQLFVLNANLSQSNWPVQPTFLPVIGEVLSSLLSSGEKVSQALVGEPMVRVLPGSVLMDTELQACKLDGESPVDDRFGTWQWIGSQSAMVWNWPEVVGPGVYALQNQEKKAYVVASNAPPVESDLSCLDESVLTTRVAGARSVGFASNDESSTESDQLWNWLIVVCTFGLIVEIASLRWSQM
jgi:hypothetical protein